MVGIAVRGVQPSYARELDISKDIPHVNANLCLYYDLTFSKT